MYQLYTHIVPPEFEQRLLEPHRTLGSHRPPPRLTSSKGDQIHLFALNQRRTNFASTDHQPTERTGVTFGFEDAGDDLGGR